MTSRRKTPLGTLSAQNVSNGTPVQPAEERSDGSTDDKIDHFNSATENSHVEESINVAFGDGSYASINNESDSPLLLRAEAGGRMPSLGNTSVVSQQNREESMKLPNDVKQLHENVKSLSLEAQKGSAAICELAAMKDKLAIYEDTLRKAEDLLKDSGKRQQDLKDKVQDLQTQLENNGKTVRCLKEQCSSFAKELSKVHQINQDLAEEGAKLWPLQNELTNSKVREEELKSKIRDLECKVMEVSEPEEDANGSEIGQLENISDELGAGTNRNEILPTASIEGEKNGSIEYQKDAQSKNQSDAEEDSSLIYPLDDSSDGSDVQKKAEWAKEPSGLEGTKQLDTVADELGSGRGANRNENLSIGSIGEIAFESKNHYVKKDSGFVRDSSDGDLPDTPRPLPHCHKPSSGAGTEAEPILVGASDDEERHPGLSRSKPLASKKTRAEAIKTRPRPADGDAALETGKVDATLRKKNGYESEDSDFDSVVGGLKSSATQNKNQSDAEEDSSLTYSLEDLTDVSDVQKKAECVEDLSGLEGTEQLDTVVDGLGSGANRNDNLSIGSVGERAFQSKNHYVKKDSGFVCDSSDGDLPDTPRSLPHCHKPSSGAGTEEEPILVCSSDDEEHHPGLSRSKPLASKKTRAEATKTRPRPADGDAALETGKVDATLKKQNGYESEDSDFDSVVGGLSRSVTAPDTLVAHSNDTPDLDDPRVKFDDWLDPRDEYAEWLEDIIPRDYWDAEKDRLNAGGKFRYDPGTEKLLYEVTRECVGPDKIFNILEHEHSYYPNITGVSLTNTLYELVQKKYMGISRKMVQKYVAIVEKNGEGEL